ncbi:shikimate dehydrogenase [Thalassotalea sp. 42_200_T64]|nr:shikimate dehydrogenase [Thalassotalea sp. 42_200_T64]
MDKYLVFGNPIAQSKSPAIHQMFAEQTKQSMHYDKFLSNVDDFVKDIESFKLAGGKGANITAPFKEQAMKMCDQLSSRAQAAGAVNTLIFSKQGITGDNTDGVGLVNDLITQQVTLTGKKVLLMGAGGASRGVILPLLAQNPEQLIIVNRTTDKAMQLAKRFDDPRLTVITFAETEKHSFDVIINATSASLSANLPALSANAITAQTVCYDMVYGKQLSPFLIWCQQQGAKQVIDGLGMLVGQAAESFYLWRKVSPEPLPVMQRLRDQLRA